MNGGGGRGTTRRTQTSGSCEGPSSKVCDRQLLLQFGSWPLPFTLPSHPQPAPNRKKLGPRAASYTRSKHTVPSFSIALPVSHDFTPCHPLPPTHTHLAEVAPLLCIRDQVQLVERVIYPHLKQLLLRKGVRDLPRTAHRAHAHIHAHPNTKHGVHRARVDGAWSAQPVCVDSHLQLHKDGPAEGGVDVVVGSDALSEHTAHHLPLLPLAVQA
jgi:hypothetical protein